MLEEILPLGERGRGVPDDRKLPPAGDFGRPPGPGVVGLPPRAGGLFRLGAGWVVPPAAPPVPPGRGGVPDHPKSGPALLEQKAPGQEGAGGRGPGRGAAVLVPVRMPVGHCGFRGGRRHPAADLGRRREPGRPAGGQAFRSGAPPGRPGDPPGGGGPDLGGGEHRRLLRPRSPCGRGTRSRSGSRWRSGPTSWREKRARWWRSPRKKAGRR